MKSRNLPNVLTVSILWTYFWLYAPAADAANPATVLSLQGRATQQRAGSTPKPLRVGDALAEGAYLATGPDGHMQVTLADRSVLTLGPNSNLKLETVNASPGVATPTVNILRGQVKTSVPPVANPARVRLVIRTRSAVMGVRGTEFQVLFNATNEITSVVTFEGSVAMTKNTGPGAETKLFASAGEGASVVTVTPGNFSTLSPQAVLPTTPQKISPLQLESLRRDRATSAGPATAGAGRGVLYLPPGLDARAASTQPLKDGGDLPSSAPHAPPPEGGVDAKTGAVTPPAGGYLDLKTALYIPPPPGSAFDAQTGVFIPPASFGSVDPKSGEYVPPAGFSLDAKKGFVADHPDRAGGAVAPGQPPRPTAGLPGAGAPSGPSPEDIKKGIPGWFQPNTPVNDPFCPTCAPLPPPIPPPSTNTLIHFNILVQ